MFQATGHPATTNPEATSAGLMLLNNVLFAIKTLNFSFSLEQSGYFLIVFPELQFA